MSFQGNMGDKGIEFFIVHLYDQVAQCILFIDERIDF